MNNDLASNNLVKFYTFTIEYINGVLIEHDYFKNNRRQKGFNNTLKKFTNTDDKKALKAYYHTLITYLDYKNNNHFTYSITNVEYNDLVDSITEYVEFVDYDLITGILKDIKTKDNNYEKLMRKYLNKYLELFTSNKLTKVIEEPKKEEIKEDVKEEKEETSNKTIAVEKNIVKYNSTTNINLQNNEIEHIRKRLYNNEDNEPLTTKEKQRLVEIFNLANRNTYYSEEVIDKAFNTNLNLRNISNSINLLDSIINTTLDCFTIRLYYLKENNIFTRDMPTNRLFNLMGANNTIKLYDVAYNMFIRNFNKLDIGHQVEIRNNFNNKEYNKYRKSFGFTYFKILSTNELEAYINNAISEYVIENYEYYTDIEKNNCYYYLLHVTKDMNIDNIVNLYFGLKNKLNKELSEKINDTNNELEIQKTYNNKITKIQEYFSIILDTKINKNVYNDNYENRLRRLFKICDTYLNDIPKFNNITINKDANKEEIKEDKNIYYGIDKIKESYYKINSKWSRLDNNINEKE